MTYGVEVNGQYFAHAVDLTLDPSPSEVGYNLGRGWQKLNATVGLRDDSKEGEKVRLDVIGDGRTLYSHVFTLGQSESISLNVAGVLRLKLAATLTSEYQGRADAVWGDARLTH